MKITYLLGAGASYNALPIINEFHDVMNTVYNVLNDTIINKRITNDKIDEDIRKKYKFICEDANSLFRLDYFNKRLKTYIDKLESFSTIDSYAKYLFINKNKYGIEEYNRYKLFISGFFTLFQDHFYKFYFQVNDKNRHYVKSDLRYSDFLVNILGENKLPNNLMIFSWNYDFQFQYALKDFFPDKFSRFDLVSPFNSGFFNVERNTFFLYQLNGIANNQFINENHYKIDFDDRMVTKNDHKFIFLKNVLLQYLSLDSSPLNSSNISYAWENELSEIIKNKVDITEHLKETTHLIIIGYSFPFTNRKIDKEIFKYLDHNKIESIVFQNPNINFDIDILFNYFKGQVSKNLVDKFKHIKECDNFYIPYEYDNSFTSPST